MKRQEIIKLIVEKSIPINPNHRIGYKHNFDIEWTDEECMNHFYYWKECTIHNRAENAKSNELLKKREELVKTLEPFTKSQLKSRYFHLFV